MTKLLEPPEGRQVFSLTVTPKDSDIDANGHVNNVWMSRPFEGQERWAWIVIRHEVDYRRALMPGETATVRTWVADETQGPRFDRYVRVDGPDGAMCAQARTVWCLIDVATRRPVRVPAEFIARYT
jgi:acyl-CoA thioester hydrolase